ncbi:winged helix-turn-helix domain-containing protein [Agrobacterium vaccinii]|uniref:winged helix-turn-helix domain-containing protein n=1 Tax=Agrobacterium vaccinii TaxID=2735528 RepID=UPI001E5F6508|nr:winged helix-turn-helix domain-containing protein [Agrobacterium vaccinii]UHS55819.1 winged helix-turn-helix domain-containing protein [Agrobacterium vaccinii]UHS60509.1 winged helix-turn-helix domain-containing protein [Agrobacterium vaccinii]
MAILISNEAARRIFLARQGLSAPPSRAMGKADLLKLITDLGFVQLDSIATVERAHHQIIFSRNQTYKRQHLTELLEKDRALFEHWTHDASILPATFYPYWKHRFRRREPIIQERWRNWHGEGFDSAFEETYRRIAENGPTMSRDMKAEGHQSGGWWNWHPSKTALEYLWHTGKLAVAGRVNFQKVYDLAERVIPSEHHDLEVDHDAFVDWACREALTRLGFATSGEISAFFDIVTPQEARAWVMAHRDELCEVSLASSDGTKERISYAFEGFASGAEAEIEPPNRIRVLSPFDPLLRNRARTERLFGFFYRIEVFVPEPKRQYGYYVFPLLEGDRLVGRIDMKAERKGGTLDVRRLWLEKGVRASSVRLAKLDAELSRLAKFTGVESVRYLDGWLG